MTIIRTGLIGLGQIGFSYDEYIRTKPLTSKSHLGSLLRNKNIKISALVDQNPIRRELVFKETGLKAIDFDEFHYSKVKLDLIILSVPSNSHLEIFSKIVNCFDTRWFLLEKPMGINLKEAAMINDLAKNSSAQIGVNFFRSVMPHIDKLKSKWLNEILNFRFVEINGYGSLLNIFSHFIHLFGNLINFDVLEFQSVRISNKVIKIILHNDTLIQLNNIGGKFMTDEIMKIHSPKYIFIFKNNGARIDVINVENNKLEEIFSLDFKNNYQEIALKQYLKQFNKSEKKYTCDAWSALYVHNFIHMLGDEN